MSELPLGLLKYRGLANALTELSIAEHEKNVAAGWWSDPQTGEPYNKTDFHVQAMKLSLIHSEVSECLEALRKDLMDDKLPHRKGGEVELADAVIRIFDFAASQGYDLGAAIVEKAEFNSHRPDHKVENRQQEGGKRG